MLFPVPPAIFLHPFFPCSFFVSHILTYLYFIFQSSLAPLIGGTVSEARGSPLRPAGRQPQLSVPATVLRLPLVGT